jgi:hypothetical protein
VNVLVPSSVRFLYPQPGALRSKSQSVASQSQAVEPAASRRWSRKKFSISRPYAERNSFGYARRKNRYMLSCALMLEQVQ